MLKLIFQFLKNPEYTEDSNSSFWYRFKVLIKTLLIALGFSFCFLIINSIWEISGILDLSDHAFDKILKEYGLPLMVVMAVVVAPILEELIFRGPLIFFKKSPYFKLIFYVLAILFGIVHITNFEISPTVLALTPFLVAPQLFVGFLAGYIRVKFGLLWSIALHALYNFILFTPIILLTLLGIPLE